MEKFLTSLVLELYDPLALGLSVLVQAHGMVGRGQAVMRVSLIRINAYRSAL